MSADMARSAKPTARVFFALLPPTVAQLALGELAREVARRTYGRPVPAENTHITLAFIGSWPISRTRMLLEAAEDVAGKPMRITLDALGAFRRAGIAWIGSSSAPAALSHLQASLAAALTSRRIAFDDAQPYRPHVTLARRCRGPYPSGGIEPIAFEVDRFTLMQSQTRAEGARYTILAQWPLA
jgi:RNA 2',3'-cyclic 3'-phosphodiesterase